MAVAARELVPFDTAMRERGLHHSPRHETESARFLGAVLLDGEGFGDELINRRVAPRGDLLND